MSDTNKTTCPVCFTRMRTINKVLTCPECGYKYCDHSRDLQDMFNTSHTHEPNYTTYTNNTASTQNNHNHTTSNYNSQHTTYTTVRPTASSARPGSTPQPAKKNVGKVVKIIVIIYLIAMFGPMICGVLGFAITAGMDLITTNLQEDYLVPEVAETDSSYDFTDDYIHTDLDTVLEEVGATSPILLETEDGAFVSDLVKHIFSVSDCQDVTNEEISNIYYLEIYPNADDYLIAYYYTNDGDAGQFTSEVTTFKATDLNTFIGLEYLYTPFTTYSEGDLDDLKLLKSLSCKNTPSSLLGVLDNPKQLMELELNLPYGTSSLDGLEAFSNVTILKISAQNTQLTNAQQIAKLQNLYRLSYTDAGAMKDFSFLSELPELSHLHLNALCLSDLSFLYDLSELQSFKFFASDVTDLEPITAVADTLTSLDMSFNTYITDLSPLEELTELEYLTMEYCNLTDINFASELENLTCLNIQNNQVTTLEPLSELSQLSQLSVNNNPLEDYAGLEHLCD